MGRVSTAETPPPGPGRRVNRPLIAVALVAIVMAAVLVVVLVRRGGDDGPPPGRAEGVTAIRTADGITLAARVTRPAGSGRHPLVVMPASYSADFNEYVMVARTLTAAGFVTVSYTQRGFGTSGGTVDLAGTKTRQDARTVIDWALRDTSADPSRIGMLGASYGGGISLLTAAADPRVRAVVAFSTWTDLQTAFRPNVTTNALGLGGLLTVARADPQLTRLALALRADPLDRAGRFAAFARPRSPATYLDALNRNKPAIMIANGWEDSLLSPAMLVPFYDRLTTPKRLQLSSGDHLGPERDMLAGRSSRTGDAAYAWLEHYLAGKDNGIDTQRPVQLQDMATGAVSTYRSWPAPRPLSLALAAPTTSGVGVTTTASAPWTASLTVGQDSGATIGNSQFVPSEQYRVPTVKVADLPADRALVWAAGPVTADTRVLGSVRYALAAQSDASAVALFGYLYDLAPDRTGRLMAMTPATVTNANGGQPRPVSVEFEPVDWTLQPGHQLALVIDTVEPWWIQPAATGSRLALSSTAAAPAALSVPLG